MTRRSLIEIVRQIPQCQIYLVAGPTGAGKTSFSQELGQYLEAVILSLDNYFLDSEQVEYVYSEKYGNRPQWDSPSACDFDLLTQNIKELLISGHTLVPKYSFFQNKRVGYVAVQKYTHQSLIVEGLHAIKCKDLLDIYNASIFSIFITAHEDIRATRIKSRDLHERGRQESLFEERFHFIKLAEEQWIMQQQDNSNFLIDTSTLYPDISDLV